MANNTPKCVMLISKFLFLMQSTQLPFFSIFSSVSREKWILKLPVAFGQYC